MAFTWPNNATGYSNAGFTTLKWGTRGMTATSIVVSADQTREVEKIYVEQGDGLKATRIMLDQGSTWDFTLIDDSTVTWPVIGDAVNVIDMTGSGSASNAYAYKGVVLDNNYRAARKQEGHRVIRLESLRLIDTTNTTSNAVW